MGLKYMDLTEFRELGFLQEVNRMFFHPLGLALEMVGDENGKISSFGGVWDYRDDPEGMLMGKLDTEKMQRVAELRDSKVSFRVGMNKPDYIYIGPDGVQTKDYPDNQEGGACG